MVTNLLPQMITFTGLDERTDLEEVARLADEFDCVEFGVLFSPRKQGRHPRYPGLNVQRQIIDLPARVSLAAHLCGAYARDVESWPLLGEVMPRLDAVQVNNLSPDLDALFRVRQRGDVPFILPTRAACFPADQRFSWLHDCSGGRGEVTAEFPQHPTGESHDALIVGFAGGINPDNVLEVIAQINSKQVGPYWLDMESGVRTDDWLDLSKVRKVLEAVYGR